MTRVARGEKLLRQAESRRHGHVEFEGSEVERFRELRWMCLAAGRWRLRKESTKRPEVSMYQS